jgi:hypothetical protein
MVVGRMAAHDSLCDIYSILVVYERTAEKNEDVISQRMVEYS